MKAVSLIDVLNNEEWRSMLEGIEDTLSSLDGRECPELSRILNNQINDLEKASGFKYIL